MWVQYIFPKNIFPDGFVNVLNQLREETALSPSTNPWQILASSERLCAQHVQPTRRCASGHQRPSTERLPS